MYSMTAYANVSLEGEWGRLVWECRSVNHRYLDLTFRMPETFHYLENKLREEARSLARGKIDCFLIFKPSSSLKNGCASIDWERVQHLVDLSEKICGLTHAPSSLNTMDLLTRSDVWVKEDMDTSTIEQPVLTLFSKAISELSQHRLKEGNFLKREIQKRTDEMFKLLKRVMKYLPEMLAEQRKRLISRFDEIKSGIDMQRLEQEMIYLAQKMDVAEELDRLGIHLNEIQTILTSSEKPIGRRLDFLMQELNREVNTLGSKTASSEVTQVVVDMKVLIEQIREQVQNIV